VPTSPQPRSKGVRAAAVLAVAAFLAACNEAQAPSRTNSPPPGTEPSASASTGPSPSPPAESPPVTPSPTEAALPVRVEQIAEVDQPLGLAVRPGDEALYVVSKSGTVSAIRGGEVDPGPP
jgi:hypothetical protein